MNDMHDAPQYDAEASALRLPPHSIPAEQAVLGSLLLSNLAYDRVADLLQEGDFYRADHRRIYAAISGLIRDSLPADVLTVSDRLGDDLHKSGGHAYLQELVASTLSAANVRRYAEIVRDRATLRALIEAATAVLDQAYQSGAKAAEVLAEAQTGVIALSRSTGREPQQLNNVMANVMTRLDERCKRSGDTLGGLSTGLIELDARWDGLLPTNLYVIGGRPSMGKSALAMQICAHAALRGTPTLVFSAEMGCESLVERTMAGAASVPLHAVKRGAMNSFDWDRMGEAVGRLNSMPLWIDDRSAPELGYIAAKARSMRQSKNIGLIMVDYLQLVTIPDKAQLRPDLIVTAIAEGLKGIAKGLGIPVIALSQLNRKCEDRPNKRPNMGDLREAGGIEQAADVIAFIYRDEVYDKDSPDAGTAEIITAKWRDGQTGMDRLAWQGQFTRFANLASDWRPAPRTGKVRGSLRDDE